MRLIFLKQKEIKLYLLQFIHFDFLYIFVQKNNLTIFIYQLFKCF